MGVTTYPGTTVETSVLHKESSRRLFDGIFAAGGITLSQVTNMTGLEPYMVQNWVKRKFVEPPQRKLYSKESFARIVIINMLKESLQIEAICNLIHIISGEPNDKSDDLISDDELYHMYVDMIADMNTDISDASLVEKRAQVAAENFKEPMPGARKKLVKILQVMFYAHSASRLIDMAKERLWAID